MKASEPSHRTTSNARTQPIANAYPLEVQRLCEPTRCRVQALTWHMISGMQFLRMVAGAASHWNSPAANRRVNLYHL